MVKENDQGNPKFSNDVFCGNRNSVKISQDVARFIGGKYARTDTIIITTFLFITLIVFVIYFKWRFKQCKAPRCEYLFLVQDWSAQTIGLDSEGILPLRACGAVSCRASRPTNPVLSGSGGSDHADRLGHAKGPLACFVVASDVNLSDGHEHGGPGVCLGDG